MALSLSNAWAPCLTLPMRREIAALAPLMGHALIDALHLGSHVRVQAHAVFRVLALHYPNLFVRFRSLNIPLRTLRLIALITLITELGCKDVLGFLQRLSGNGYVSCEPDNHLLGGTIVP